VNRAEPVPAAARVRRLTAASDAELGALAALLVDAVEGGASVSFMQPLATPRARAFWQGVAESSARGERVWLVAEDDAGLLGSVQVVLAQPENQPHRADVAKLLVHRRARRRGVGEQLMRAAHAEAAAAGKTLLVLDTASDAAMRLYERLGWQRVGAIPGYALWPQGGLCDTVLYWRHVGPADAGLAAPPVR